MAVALAALATAAPGGAVSASENPPNFSATFSGRVQTTLVYTTFAGSGFATRMGSVATRGLAETTGVGTSCAGGIANVNTETLTPLSAGGSLTISSDDVGCPVGPGQFHGSGQWTVKGGTGRFSGAAGQGLTDGYVDFVAGTFTITLSGTLTP